MFRRSGCIILVLPYGLGFCAKISHVLRLENSTYFLVSDIGDGLLHQTNLVVIILKLKKIGRRAWKEVLLLYMSSWFMSVFSHGHKETSAGSSHCR